MVAKSHIAMRASPFLKDAGSSITENSYWKTAVTAIAVFLAILLVAQLARITPLEKGAEIAFFRARELLHDAEKENRNVRPVPLSQALTQFRGSLA